MIKYIILIGSLSVVGCLPSVPDVVEGNTGDCGAEKYVHLIGQSDEKLANIHFASGTRIIYPRSVVTMDYRTDRLNIHVDDNHIIEKAKCG